MFVDTQICKLCLDTTGIIKQSPSHGVVIVKTLRL